jgi:hypothetical protein
MEREASVVRSAPQPSLESESESESESETSTFDPKVPPRSIFLSKLRTRLAFYN